MTKQFKSEDIEATIKISKLIHCARCDGTHLNLVFKKFTRPLHDSRYTHFYLCPTNNEPVLLKEIL